MMSTPGRMRRKEVGRVRKGQFQHVFTFIMLLMLAGVILLLGYRFISGLLGQSCQVETLKFSNTLKDDLRSYASYGSYHAPALPAPCNAEAVCFISTDKFKTAGDGTYEDQTLSSYTANNERYEGNGVILAELNHPSQPKPKSVFLISEHGKRTEPLPLFSEKIRVVGKDVLCVPARGGRFHIGFAGKGRTVVLSDES